MTEDEIEEILHNVKNELRQMDSYQQQIVTRSQNSFTEWARDVVVGLAKGLGYIISIPFRVVGEIVSGIWRALFG